jgi:vacuolar-type H+-ATPase catalytic subunit A/Vma1
VSSHDAERALIAARLDHLSDRFDRAAEAMAADLDLYRDDWSSRHAEQLRAHNERVDSMAAEQAEWLRNFYADGDESAPTDVDRQGSQDASGRGPATPAGVPAGQPIHEAELERAQALKQMSMQEYAALRAELGVRSPTSMDHLFRQETR